VSFKPLPLYPWIKSSGSHWIGGWVEHRVGIDAIIYREKNLASGGNRTPVVEPVTIPTELSRLVIRDIDEEKFKEM
jgi:hypothetical protein